MSKKTKVELTSAVIMTIVFLSFGLLSGSRKPSYYGDDLQASTIKRSGALDGLPVTQQTIHENIQGELKRLV